MWPFVGGLRDTEPPGKDVTQSGEGGRARGRGHSRAPALGASPPGTKEPAGRRPREPLVARQLLAVAVADLQRPLPSPTPARLSVSSLPPYGTARARFRAPGALLSIRAGGAGAGGCGAAAGPPAWGAGAFVSQSLRSGPLPPPGPCALCPLDFAPRRALLLLLRLRAGPRLARASGRPGAAGPPAQHG